MKNKTYLYIGTLSATIVFGSLFFIQPTHAADIQISVPSTPVVVHTPQVEIQTPSLTSSTTRVENQMVVQNSQQQNNDAPTALSQEDVYAAIDLNTEAAGAQSQETAEPSEDPLVTTQAAPVVYTRTRSNLISRTYTPALTSMTRVQNNSPYTAPSFLARAVSLFQYPNQKLSGGTTKNLYAASGIMALMGGLTMSGVSVGSVRRKLIPQLPKRTIA